MIRLAREDPVHDIGAVHDRRADLLTVDRLCRCCAAVGDQARDVLDRDVGFWGRDERSSLRWLARLAGASCQVVYLPVDRDVQLARIARGQLSAPHQTYLMTEVDIDRWREQFQAPDAAELDGNEIPGPPAGWPGWAEWAADRWPSLADG